jgi:hypothetical protein
VVVRQLSEGKTRNALAAMAAQGRVIEIPDRRERLRAVSDDFLRDPKRTIVVTPDNASRRELNAVIHAALQAGRTVSSDQVQTRVLIPRQELTGADRLYAGYYEPGDVVRYSKGSKQLGVEPGAYAEVVSRDTTANTVTVQREDGTRLTYNPSRLSGVSVYQTEDRAFAVGDRVQFTAPSKDLRVANRELGTLERLEDGRATIRLEGGRTLRYRIADHPHLDYGYAVTSHSAQGQTADRVLIHVDTERAGSASQRFTYVSISRGRHEATIYTDDAARIGHKLAREVSHRASLEA